MFTETQVTRIDEIVKSNSAMMMVQAFEIAIRLEQEIGMEAVRELMASLKYHGFEAMISHIDSKIAIYDGLGETGKKNSYWMIKSNIKSSLGI